MSAPFKQLKKRGRKRKNAGALTVHADPSTQVVVEVIDLGDLQPISKPTSLVTKKVATEDGVVCTILGFNKESGTYIVRRVCGEQDDQEWDESRIRLGLQQYKKFVL
jgi:hypothetical protein